MTYTVNGETVSNQPPITAIKQGVAHIPEDRNHVGSAPNMTITENTIKAKKDIVTAIGRSSKNRIMG